MKTFLLSYALLLAFGGAAFAQNAGQTSFGESHKKAAVELLDAMNMQATLDAVIDAQLEVQLSQMPQLAQVEGVMRDFFTKYMSYEAMRDDYVDLYVSAYTEKELRQLKKFYGTTLGKKVIATTPELTAAGTKLGQQVVADHMMELQEAIMAKMQEGAND